MSHTGEDKPMTKMRKITALLLGAAMLLAACGDSDDESSDTTAAADSGGGDGGAVECGTIDFLQPIPESIIFWPLLLGNELGYFEEEGIEVNLLPGGDLPETAFVENGDADIASAGGPEVLQAIDAGSDIVVVYDYWNVAAEGLVTLSGGAGSVEDLGTIGLVTDSDLATVTVIFDTLGLDPDSVDTIVLGESPAVLVEALENGTVDAVAGAIIDFIGMQAAGIELVDLAPDSFKASPTASFVVTPDTLENNGDCIEGFLRAWAKATYAGLHNGENTQAIGRSLVPEEWEDETVGVASYEVSVTPQEPVNGTDFGVVQTDVWQTVADQLIAAGELDASEIDVDSFIDQRLVDAANDWDRGEVESEIDGYGG